jgi:hypothetical protein
VRIPDSCTQIGRKAFIGTRLTEVVIPGACEIGASAFERCPRLTTVVIGAGRSWWLWVCWTFRACPGRSRS